MNYKKIYEDFIKDRLNKQPIHKSDGSSELHHITPRCLGGSNDKSNLIRLKTSEHIFAHLLLAKIYGGKLYAPLFLMYNAQQWKITNKRTRTLFEKSRIEYSKHKSKTMKGKSQNLSDSQINERSKRFTGENNPMFGRFWITNITTLENRLIKHTDIIPDGFIKGKSFSEKTKNLISLSKTGDKNPSKNIEVRKKRSEQSKGENNPRFGVKLDDTLKEKIRITNEQTRLKKLKENPIICPHCGKIGTTKHLMERFHFDNCKTLSAANVAA